MFWNRVAVEYCCFSQKQSLFKPQKLAAAKILETMNQAKDIYKSLMEEVSLDTKMYENVTFYLPTVKVFAQA